MARDASPLQVARAHRRLAKEHHPDLHEGADVAAERMRRINEAWAVLSDPARRAEYDHEAGIVSQGHWAASRTPITPSAPTSTRTWATWRATAADTRQAPPTARQPGEVPDAADSPPATARSPSRRHSETRGGPRVVAGGLILALLLGAIIVGRLAL